MNENQHIPLTHHSYEKKIVHYFVLKLNTHHIEVNNQPFAVFCLAYLFIFFILILSFSRLRFRSMCYVYLCYWRLCCFRLVLWLAWCGVARCAMCYAKHMYTLYRSLTFSIKKTQSHIYRKISLLSLSGLLFDHDDMHSIPPKKATAATTNKQINILTCGNA